MKGFIPYGGRTNVLKKVLNAHDFSYPLRGTNKRSLGRQGQSRSYLSPTGDEQTFFLFMKYLTCSFIPYGGRTNVLLRTLQTPLSIYPLRGTNEHFIVANSVVLAYLSPTGDEQTSPAISGYFWILFIPYGGRTNFRSSNFIGGYRIYPLRGTNKLQ